MKDTDIRNKPRKPDYINTLYFQNGQGKDQRMSAPDSWTNDDGKIITKTPFGTLVQTPREQLEKLRQEQKIEAAQTPVQQEP
jgi:hypothetical protein